MATIAVFLGLGGGAYAALKLPNNSVGPKQIAKNAVRSGEVKNNSLTGRDIRESKLATVPSAQNAAHAAHAANADLLAGLGPGAFVGADRLVVRNVTANWSLPGAEEGVTVPVLTRGRSRSR